MRRKVLRASRNICAPNMLPTWLNGATKIFNTSLKRANGVTSNDALNGNQMTTSTHNTGPWQYPDWIYTVRRKLACIDLDKMPARVWLEHKVIPPHENKYYPAWAVSVTALMSTKDRIKGTPSSIQNGNGNGLYLYDAKDCEHLVCAEIGSLLKHELYECFQLREHLGDKTVIPFDPHDDKAMRVSWSATDRVNYERYYPSWSAGVRWRFKQWRAKKYAAFWRWFVAFDAAYVKWVKLFNALVLVPLLVGLVMP